MEDNASAQLPIHSKPIRDLPKKEFVSLTEAVTWIAFKRPLDSIALQEELFSYNTDQVKLARAELILATTKLTDLASGGHIVLRGKHIQHAGVNENQVLTKDIPSTVFHDFGQFDALHDGFRRGDGLAWRSSPEGDEWAIGNAAGEAYLSVKVQRDALLKDLSRNNALNKNIKSVDSDSEVMTKKKPGPKPNPLWSEVIQEVIEEATKAKYCQHLKRGHMTAIQSMIENKMLEKETGNKALKREPGVSPAAALKHVPKVVSALPACPDFPDCSGDCAI